MTLNSIKKYMRPIKHPVIILRVQSDFDKSSINKLFLNHINGEVMRIIKAASW